ncbi:MAG: hypothetical protein CVV21_06810 [Candidatus Goldiibacteriota bacterium HGW-Goldbacteria-1]|jgi:ABC-type uncharacterized transport system involved in gliding motility auxiliary subunit|nr:MAG: hypothetical protein CVV21_06810 [Candidatus Goldiibacteriota bacterium HGW-Goldbacteria-1]
MVGVILGVLLLLLLIGLVVLQGMIEWGGFDFEKFMNKKGSSASAPAPSVKADTKKSVEKKPAKTAAKTAPKTAKKAAPKKVVKGKGKK